MLFTTPSYILFLLVVMTVHFILPGRWRWLWLLVAGYAFYASWSPAYMTLLLYATGITYGFGRWLPSVSVGNRRRVLWLGVANLLMPLLFFKYYNFAAQTVGQIAAWAEFTYAAPTHAYLLPVGISFFTFQAISYLVDVYRAYQKPEKHLGYLALYVAFFPVLLAGPIVRAKHVVGQFRQQRGYHHQDALAGLLLILWGCFKKVILAQRLQEYVSLVFDQPATHYGISVLAGCYFFALQLYCDFSGYSDIAIGSARVLGIRLSPNFANRVYASRSRTEFWQGWHISLTSWFRDYVFTSLSKYNRSRAGLYGNILFVYLLTGLWHGAAWSFVIWGMVNGLWLVTEQMSRPARRSFFERIGFGPTQRLHQILSTLVTFTAGALIGMWFRVQDTTDGLTLLRNLFVTDWQLVIPGMSNFKLLMIMLALLFMDLVHQWVGKRSIDEALLDLPSRFVRWSVATLLVEAILLFSRSEHPTFYYFKF